MGRPAAALALLALWGCAPAPQPAPSPPPRFDWVRGAQCVRDDLRRQMLASGEAIDGMTADDDARAVDRALDQCAFPAGYERGVEQTSDLLAASSIRHEVSRPYRERRAAEATRRNIAQAEQRDAQVGEAGRRYLACVLEAASALARASAEAAPVIAEAATAECPAEAGRLAGLDWQMKGAIDRAARPAVLARILRVRGGEGAP